MNPLPFECKEVTEGCRARLDLDKKIPIPRLMIERQHQVQRMPGKRLPQPLRRPPQFRSQRWISGHEGGCLGRDRRKGFADVIAAARQSGT